MATLIHDTDRMSSLEIAELTGKRHDAILRDIRNLLKQGGSAHNFVETSYRDKSNRQSPCFELTKKGCLILAFQILLKTFAVLKSIRIFAVLQIIIYYAKGIFYAQKASIFKIYREVVSVYHSRWQMIVCSKIGYDFSFFINNK